MRARSIPTQEQLKEVFSYDAELGRLVWRKRVGRALPGQIAGFLHGTGYRHISIGGLSYSEHRLIWGYHFGPVPQELDIDHLDGNRAHNRIENLRTATRSENAQNQKRGHVDNRTGKLGVTKLPDGKFLAQVYLNRKRVFRRTATTSDAAAELYLTEKRKHHPANTL